MPLKEIITITSLTVIKPNPSFQEIPVYILTYMQGALHVLLISTMMTVFTHDWAMLNETLPIIVKVRMKGEGYLEW